MLNDDRFDRYAEQFDKSFKRAQDWASRDTLFVALLGVSLLVGGGFVIYKLLVYFGIL